MTGGSRQSILKEFTMRKFMIALSAATIAAAALATPALADMDVITGEVVTGAAVGTAVGVGLSEGWFGSSVAATSLGATAGTAAAVGGVAGIGTIALLDGAIEPCSGFHALFGLNRDECANGQYVGYAPRRMHR
jgi:hypothetical protein